MGSMGYRQAHKCKNLVKLRISEIHKRSDMTHRIGDQADVQLLLVHLLRSRHWNITAYVRQSRALQRKRMARERRRTLRLAVL